MINLMVANFQPGRGCSLGELDLYLRAQIENSRSFGWPGDRIAIITNFPFEFDGIKAQEMSLNLSCLTGSKIFAVAEFINGVPNDEVVWCHDLDVWQNAEFVEPDFKEVGICCYSTPKYNGGSVFYRSSALDLVKLIRDEIVERKSGKEEPVINDVLRRAEYKDRVTVLNSTFNVGCSGYRVRYAQSEKPLKCVHFHPTNRIAWDTHARNRNGISLEATISSELRETLVRYFGTTIGAFRYEDGLEPFMIRANGVDRRDGFLRCTEIYDFFCEHLEVLSDADFLEEAICSKFGVKLNREKLKLPDMKMGGVKTKQYPKELAQLLCFLHEHRENITSYLEIGVENGGTFFIIDSYLRAICPDYEMSLGIDVSDKIQKNDLAAYQKRFPSCTFERIDAKNFRVPRRFSLCLIDGDHSYNGVRTDYFKMRDRVDQFIMFHDIKFSAKGVGVGQLWNELAGEKVELVDTAATVPLGIGIIRAPIGGEHGKAPTRVSSFMES